MPALSRALSRLRAAPRVAASLIAHGVPRQLVLFGPLSLGDDLLCTAVLHEARRRGRPLAMMTARPELFRHNPDPTRLLPVDDDLAAGLRRLGSRVIKPYYVSPDGSNPARDLLPGRHVIAEMCALAGLHGKVALRPYLHLTASERAGGRKFPRQIVIHSTGLNAAVPYPTKEWGAKRFTRLIQLIGHGVPLIQLGHRDDPALPVDLDLRGKTTLREAAAVLSQAELLVGLEGFLVHLARSVDCPAVVVMGGRAPAGVFGYAANRNLTHLPACGGCGLRLNCPHGLACLEAITPEAVARAVQDGLERPIRPLPVETVELP